MITVGEADMLLAGHVRQTLAETVDVVRVAGRVLRMEVTAARDYPPFHRVTMDGVAIRFDPEAPKGPFQVCRIQRAGEAPLLLESTESGIEVMTGAVLPDGCDTVIRKEDLRIEGTSAVVGDGATVRRGQNVHTRGSDRCAGASVLRAGTRLGPGHVAVLATEGHAAIAVAARPRVALLTTGDELVGVGQPVAAHQIRQSNGPALQAALLLHGYAPARAAHAPDDEGALRAEIDASLGAAEVLILTGGVSAGRFDLVPALLAEAGVHEVFHRVAQRPGKPFWFGTTAGGKVAFGLPGNPVSAFVCFYRYVLPFLAATEGAPRGRPSVRLREALAGNSDLTRFVPVRVDGPEATLLPGNGSGDFLALLPSDGFVEVAPGASTSDPVPFYSWGPS